MSQGSPRRGIQTLWMWFMNLKSLNLDGGGGNKESETHHTRSIESDLSMASSNQFPSAGYGSVPSADDPCEKLRKESEELCFLQQLKPAHDKAVAALKQATELYGKSSLRLVPFYLVLVEIALQERQLKQAEEVLSLVNWLLVKDRKAPTAGGPPATSPSGPSVHTLHGGGHHNEDEPLPEEMKNLFVIRMNKLYSHLYTSELYFCLGSIFSRMQTRHPAGQPQKQQRDSENALGMFDKVVDIWYRFLTNPPEETAAWMLEHQRLRIYEASNMLQQIITVRSASLGACHVATGEVLYTQGLMFLFLGDHTQAKMFVNKSLDVYSNNLVRVEFGLQATKELSKLGMRVLTLVRSTVFVCWLDGHQGPEHPSTLDVRNVLQQLHDAGV